MNRNSAVDNDDVYLDTLREQAILLGISLNTGSEEDILKKYPSSKDLDKKFTRNILSRRGDEEEVDIKKEFNEKRRSILERDSFSL